MKFSEKVGDGPVNKQLNFGGDPDYRLDTGIVFRIRHYWEIRKIDNGHKSAVHTDSSDGGTDKTCFGGGMHCPSASSYGRSMEYGRPLYFHAVICSSSFFFLLFSSPNLSRRRLDVCHTSTHGVALVRI